MSVTHTPMGRHSVLKSSQCRIFQQQEEVPASTLPSPRSPPAEVGTTPSSASAIAVTDRTAKYRQFADECMALAKRINNRELRTAFLGMAELWTSLADPQPNAHQQQKAQPEGNKRLNQKNEAALQSS